MFKQAGMTSINDFATTYMCQSLPFGGVKDSGFDRFAGVEGLRGLCVAKAVAEDRCGIICRPFHLLPNARQLHCPLSCVDVTCILIGIKHAVALVVLL